MLEVASFFQQILPDPVYHVIDWPMNTGPDGGYNFWSGIAGQSIVGYALVSLRRVNCSAPWCFRVGRHPSADGLHKFCRKHHPELPSRPLSLEELHERHDVASDQTPS